MSSRLLPFALSVLSVASIHAGLLLEETFNYPLGTINQTAGTGFGETGNWSANYNGAANATADIVSKTWLPAGITNYTATTGTKGLTADTTGDRAVIKLSTAIDFDANGTFYFSFLQRRNDASGGAVFALSNSTQGFFNDLARVNNVGGTAISGGLDNVSGGTPVNTSNIYLNTTADWLVLGRITASTTAGADKIEIAAIADGGTMALSFDSLSGIQTITDTVIGSADYVGFWNFNTTNNMTFGSVRIGDTFASVTAVPEPSSLMAFTILFLTFVLGRRRRA